jgi:hypothetical protein
MHLFLMKFKEYYNMICVKLRSVNLPVTVTNKGGHVAKRWQIIELKIMEQEKFLG